MNILTPVIWIRAKTDFKIGRSIFPMQKKISSDSAALSYKFHAGFRLREARPMTIVHHKARRLKFMTNFFSLIRVTSKVAIRSLLLNLDSNPWPLCSTFRHKGNSCMATRKQSISCSLTILMQQLHEVGTRRASQVSGIESKTTLSDQEGRCSRKDKKEHGYEPTVNLP